jgi:hypothetical protein
MLPATCKLQLMSSIGNEDDGEDEKLPVCNDFMLEAVTDRLYQFMQVKENHR